MISIADCQVAVLGRKRSLLKKMTNNAKELPNSTKELTSGAK